MGDVVVCVDGSASATAALDWAVGEARRRSAGVRLVTVYPWPVAGYPTTVVPPATLREGLHRHARNVLDTALDRARTEAPSVNAVGDLRRGDPVTELVAASREGDVVVVGTRGLGGVASLVLGSTATGVIAHSQAPVVVVLGQSAVDGPVVAGVSGGAADEAVLEFAAEQATASGASLVVARALDDWLLELVDHLDRGQLDLDQLVERIAENLDGTLTRLRTRYPTLDVKPVVERARAAKRLTELSSGAHLLVIGAGTRHGLFGQAVGPVAHSVLRHASCPVALVHPAPGKE